MIYDIYMKYNILLLLLLLLIIYEIWYLNRMSEINVTLRFN